MNNKKQYKKNMNKNGKINKKMNGKINKKMNGKMNGNINKKMNRNINKKIYFKDIKIQNLKPNIINNLKKKFIYKIKNIISLISNNGIYIFNKNILKKYTYISKILNETDNLIEINHYLKYSGESSQIPFEHNLLKIYEISFIFDDYFLVFELIDDEINDFYIKTNNSLNILDILMIKELSYIKNLLI